MTRLGPYEICVWEEPSGILLPFESTRPIWSGFGRELMPRAMGARKYPWTSVCQPSGGTSGFASVAGGGAMGAVLASVGVSLAAVDCGASTAGLSGVGA